MRFWVGSPSSKHSETLACSVASAWLHHHYCSPPSAVICVMILLLPYSDCLLHCGLCPENPSDTGLEKKPLRGNTGGNKLLLNHAQVGHNFGLCCRFAGINVKCLLDDLFFVCCGMSVCPWGLSFCPFTLQLRLQDFQPACSGMLTPAPEKSKYQQETRRSE